MKINKIIIFISLFSILALHATSHAAEKAKRKKQVLNFEDELIKGDAQKPELFYLLERKQYNFKKLIRLRENFIPEMKSTAEDIQAVGSGS